MSARGLGLLAPPLHADIPPEHEGLSGRVLAEANARRAAIGELPVELDARLSAAAQKHAEYLVVNIDKWDDPKFSAHWESAEYPGFYGATSGDRELIAGFPHSRVTEDVTQVKGGGVWSAERIIARWIDPPLHRRPILERSITEIGFGYA